MANPSAFGGVKFCRLPTGRSRSRHSLPPAITIKPGGPYAVISYGKKTQEAMPFGHPSNFPYFEMPG